MFTILTGLCMANMKVSRLLERALALAVSSGTDSPAPPSVRRHRTLVENHPVDAEAIPQLAKAGRKECLFYRQQDPAAVRKGGEYPLRLVVAVDGQLSCT